jgi:hypothetical protein
MTGNYDRRQGVSRLKTGVLASTLVGEEPRFNSFWLIAGTFTMVAITALLAGVAIFNRRGKTVLKPNLLG